MLEELETELRRATTRDVFVVLLVNNCDPPHDPAYDYEGVATVVRQYSDGVPLHCASDHETGLYGPEEALTDDTQGGETTMLRNKHMTHMVFGTLMGNYWSLGTEVYTAAPASLPQTYTEFRQAVFQCTVRLRDNEQVRLSARTLPSADGQEAVEGTVVNAHQSLVYPLTSSFNAENALVIRTTDGKRVSVGGLDSFLEDYEAISVTLDYPVTDSS